MNNSVTIIIPAYNEEENLKILLPKVISFVEERGWKCILVDDGSRDNSKDVYNSFQSEHFKVIQNTTNKGVGSATKLGFKNVETEYCISMDADGQHRLEDVEKVVAYGIENKCDLVVGERVSMETSGMYRNFGKFLIRKFTTSLLRKKVTDLNSGMRFYKSELVKKYVPLLPNSFAICEVSSILFIYQNHRVATVPIEVNARQFGVSTITTKHAFETVIEIINIFMLFSPLKIFLPLSLSFVFLGIAWAFPFLIMGKGLSVGGLLLIITGALSFFFGIIAEQLSRIRKNLIKLDE